MNRFLSITNLLLLLLHAPFLVSGGTAEPSGSEPPIQLPVIREHGSLSPSVANEADHAMRLARQWLSAHPPASTATQLCALVRLALSKPDPASDLRALAAQAELNLSTNHLACLLKKAQTSYPPATRDTEPLWRLSHAINQLQSGRLMQGSVPLDWRNDFANILISTQRRDSGGGAYWDAQGSGANAGAPPEQITPSQARIRATAFGLLALKEIHE